jgi:hypothetical protein
MATDPLDDVFNLEANFYNDGYNHGLQDGAQAGRIEGRGLGMEKGFEKFVESGRLASRAVVWANRMPREQQEARQQQQQPTQQDDPSCCSLPPLPQNGRLRKNIDTLYALVEPETLSTANTDEAVQDFDDRVKRAQGKSKIVEKMVGGAGVQGKKSIAASAAAAASSGDAAK